VCSLVAKAVHEWSHDGKPEVRIGTFSKFQDEQIWCNTCKEFVNYFVERFGERNKDLRHFTPVFLGRGSDSWYFKVGKVNRFRQWIQMATADNT
jgi:hypothetical protein